MRPIGALENETSARRFGDYLYSQGVHNEVEPGANGTWTVWVAEEEEITRAKGFLDRYLTNSSDPEYARIAQAADRKRADEQRDLAAYRNRFYDRRRLFPRWTAYGAGVVTITLIALSVGVAIYSKLGTDQAFLQHLFIARTGRAAANAGFLPEVCRGEIWRLVTPIFIHFGPAHILFNLLWVFQLGSMIEGRQSSFRLSALTLAIAAGSNLAQYAVSGPGFGGMSGVVYGLFGYVWVSGRLDPTSGLCMDQRNVTLMILWLFLCMTGMIGPIANTAHGVGLGMGVALAYLSSITGRRHH